MNWLGEKKTKKRVNKKKVTQVTPRAQTSAKANPVWI